MKENAPDHKVQLVKSIYGYVMLIVSIFLLIAGLGSGVKILAYNIAFGEYPVVDERYICQDFVARKTEGGTDIEEPVVDEECVERERKVRLIDDSIFAFVQTTAGILILFPHMALVRSMSGKKD